MEKNSCRIPVVMMLNNSNSVDLAAENDGEEDEASFVTSLLNIRDPYRKLAMNQDRDAINHHFVSSPGQLLNAPRQSVSDSIHTLQIVLPLYSPS